MVQETMAPPSDLNNIPSLFPEIREVQTAPGRGLHGYYRKPDGWIVIAATTPTNRADYEFKGFRFLPQYGQFANGTMYGAAKERDARGTPWNPAMEPWRLIFQKGGAKEFAIDQIIAYGWHRKPPYREVRFPQLEGVVISDLPCPECERFFSSINEREATAFLRRHLTSKVNDAHQYNPTDLRELGKEWGLKFESSRVRRVAAREGVPDSSEKTLSLEEDSAAVADLTPESEGPDISDLRQAMAARKRR